MAALPFLVALALVQAAAPSQPDPVQPAGDAAADAAQPDEQEVSPDPAQVPAQQVSPDPGHAPVEDAQAYPPQPYAQPGMADRRIQLLAYAPDQIVTLAVSPGFASVVELGQDERIENVVVGNSSAWQVTANRRGDRVIVKPLSGASPSNLIVLTGSRRYVFVLDPFGETSFIMRFTYPQPVQTAAAANVAAESTYKFRGHKGLYPLAMSDDGRRTVITFGEQNVLPAIFALKGRKEQLVNGRMVGNDYVIEGAALRYKFRYGTAEATAVRTLPKQRR